MQTARYLQRSAMVHQSASWDEAIDEVVTKLKSIAVRSDAIGIFGSGGLTNEKAYMFGKSARLALRTANIEYNGRFCMAC